MKSCLAQKKKSRQSLGRLTDRLRSHDRKLTAPRQAILEILREQPHPLTNKEIFCQLPAGHCDLATIYRSMRLLENMGLVQRFDFGDGAARYELTDESEGGHHHHLICTQCTEIVEVEECFPMELEQNLAAKNGFKAITHKLEFFGVCPQCQTA